MTSLLEGIEFLTDRDIVITTYGTLGHEFSKAYAPNGALRVNYLRIVLGLFV